MKILVTGGSGFISMMFRNICIKILNVVRQAEREFKMNRKTYIRDIYSDYWLTAREEIYGFSKYDRNLCHYIHELLEPRGGGRNYWMLL